MKDNKKMKYLCISVLSVLAVIVVWYVCIDVVHMKPETVFPGPVKVFRSFVDKLSAKAPDGATLQAHLWASIKVALFGYALGAVIGCRWGLRWHGINGWTGSCVRCSI